MEHKNVLYILQEILEKKVYGRCEILGCYSFSEVLELDGNQQKFNSGLRARLRLLHSLTETRAIWKSLRNDCQLMIIQHIDDLLEFDDPLMKEIKSAIVEKYDRFTEGIEEALSDLNKQLTSFGMPPIQ
jgi:hypothetical protein